MIAVGLGDSYWSEFRLRMWMIAVGLGLSSDLVTATGLGLGFDCG